MNLLVGLLGFLEIGEMGLHLIFSSYFQPTVAPNGPYGILVQDGIPAPDPVAVRHRSQGWKGS
jgi:hypothetical protein